MQKKKEIWMLQTKRADFNGLAMRLGVSPVATGHWMIFMIRDR